MNKVLEDAIKDGIIETKEVGQYTMLTVNNSKCPDGNRQKSIFDVIMKDAVESGNVMKFD